jgi:hypothetical protein
MNKSRVIVACLILIVILGGFVYAYFSKVNAFNQTNSDLESLGYEISNNVSGMDISTFIRSASVVPMVDLASFISIARQYNTTTIYDEGFSFYVIPIKITFITAYGYTPNDSVWWNSGYSDLVNGSWGTVIVFGLWLPFSFKREYLKFRKPSWKFWSGVLIECIALVLLIFWA